MQSALESGTPTLLLPGCLCWQLVAGCCAPLSPLPSPPSILPSLLQQQELSKHQARRREPQIAASSYVSTNGAASLTLVLQPSSPVPSANERAVQPDWVPGTVPAGPFAHSAADHSDTRPSRLAPQLWLYAGESKAASQGSTVSPLVSHTLHPDADPIIYACFLLPFVPRCSAACFMVPSAASGRHLATELLYVGLEGIVLLGWCWCWCWCCAYLVPICACPVAVRRGDYLMGCCSGTRGPI